ncbi:MAG: glycosyltransferase family 4 protein [Planctomycetes bacterium]|nr:glycosyltransferase family 4 protein [Planctomycetota bacterium]
MSELRIGIDYRPALISRSGIGRYVANLVRCLPEVDDEVRLALFSVFWEKHEERIAHAKLPESERVRLVASRFPGRILDFLGKFTPLSVETWADELDVFHYTDYVHLPVKTQPIVFTLHDLSFLRSNDYHPPGDNKQLAAVTHSLVQRAAVVLAVSETTRQDAIELLHLPEERVMVTPLGVDEVFLEVPQVAPQSVPTIVSVGTLEPRKNHPRLLRAFKSLIEKGLEARLVLAGRKGWMCDETLALLKDETLANHVVWLGEVSDFALQALVRGATVLAYPSLWEGFGLPVLEGMAAGVCVLTSDRGSMKEIAGDAAEFVDPESEESIAQGLDRLLSDEAHRQALIKRGRARAAIYTWRACAAATAAAYRRAVELGPPPPAES